MWKGNVRVKSLRSLAKFCIQIDYIILTLLKLFHATEKIFQFCKKSFSHTWVSQVLNSTSHQTHEADSDEL